MILNDKFFLKKYNFVNNNNIFVIDSLQYNHRLHDQSNFMISKAKPYNNFVLNVLLNKIKNSI